MGTTMATETVKVWAMEAIQVGETMTRKVTLAKHLVVSSKPTGRTRIYRHPALSGPQVEREYEVAVQL